jgi:hypothetical protein
MRTVADLRQAVRSSLPHGSPLAAEVWERRHRGMVVLLWLHALAIGALGVVKGWHSGTP